MSEMLSRVDRAITKGMAERWNVPAIARMAIEAMREPTPEMILAATDELPEYLLCHEDEIKAATDAWRVMIDEALK